MRKFGRRMMKEEQESLVDRMRRAIMGFAFGKISSPDAYDVRHFLKRRFPEATEEELRAAMYESRTRHGRMMRENTEDYNTELFDSDGEFHGEIPEECVRDCTHPGPVDDDVEGWVKVLDFRVPREPAIKYLYEFGAWDDDELNAMSNEELSQKILWIACGEIADNKYMGEEDYYWYGMRL